MRFIVSVTALVALVGLSGCGKSKTFVVGDDGEKVTVTQNGGGKVTVEGPEGKAEWTGGPDEGSMTIDTPEGHVEMGTRVKVSEAELGLPIYPGAKSAHATRVETDEMKSYSATFETDDDADAVAAFYKKRMPGATSFDSSSGDGRYVMLSSRQDDEGLNVTIAAEEGKTTVTIAHVIQK